MEGRWIHLRAFLDVETTGFEPGQIAQLSYIITDDELNVQMAKNFFFSVDSMPRKASDVHGLTKPKLKKLSGGKIFADHAQEIHGDLANTDAICHNTKFDIAFLEAEFNRLSMRLPCAPGACTMLHYTDICALPGGPRSQYKWPKLHEAMGAAKISSKVARTTAAELFGEEDLPFHDSRMDVAAVYSICKSMGRTAVDEMVSSYRNPPMTTLSVISPYLTLGRILIYLWIAISLGFIFDKDSPTSMGITCLGLGIFWLYRSFRKQS
jgi:hypothetical protein